MTLFRFWTEIRGLKKITLDTSGDSGYSPKMESDICYTPDNIAQIACRALLCLINGPSGFTRYRGEKEQLRVLEPAVGGGAFVRAFRTTLEEASYVPGTGMKTEFTGVDLDPHATGLSLCENRVVGDFTALSSRDIGLEDGELFDLAIGNPPYSEALAHIKRGIEVAKITVALLRLSFLEPTEARTEALFGPDAQYPPCAVIMYPQGYQRPRWESPNGDTKHKQPDKVCSALFVWKRDLCLRPRHPWESSAVPMVYLPHSIVGDDWKTLMNRGLR